MKVTLASCLILLNCFWASSQANYGQLAGKFLLSLSTSQQQKAHYEIESDARFKFHFYPLDDRKGISLNELNETQKSMLADLMKACFSQRGYQQVTDIFQMESILKLLEKRPENDHYRDPGKYYCIFFGNPSTDTKWSWRMEGHHVSFSFSIVNGRIVSGTPGFLGSNPAVVPEGPAKGKEVLKEETELAFKLMLSMNREQRDKAIISNKAPSEILTFVSRKAVIEDPGGVLFAQLNRDQQHLMLRLVEVYILRYTKLFADDMLKELHAAGIDKLKFAWAGSRNREESLPYYYRITGPTIIIEFDNAQNNANHIHTVVRDLQHDFGGDLLLEHYKDNH